MYLSIKTKFIILLSILMAGILGIQFYFTQQTQNDIVDELTKMSSKINEATDVEFLEENYILNNKNIPHPPPLPRHRINRWYFKSNIDSLIKSAEVFSNKDSEETVYRNFKRRLDDKIRVEVRKRESHLPEQDFLDLAMNTNTDENEDIFITDDDTMKWFVKEIEVNLNPIKERDSIKYALRGRERIKKRGEPPSFTFVVPDFSEPQSPKILRLNYSTAELQSAIVQSRNKNIIISLVIFIISILVIMLITRKFLKPIDSLKVSFEKVVDGDLDINVENDSKDEIGVLTGAFNKMVGELRKNKEKEAHLQRKERLASLGQLAAGVAHEIKNPLNAINLTIDHLGDQLVGEENEQAQQYIGTIQNEIKRLDKIVNNFLNYLGLVTTFSEHFKMRVDAARIKTTLVNIILNAIQAMQDGGQLAITTNSKSKTIHIADNGSGISAKDIEHIFDLFYTTKATGSGLGLPTAYKIIRAHGGDIEINSEPNQGTEVIIKFK
ncbi:MAG: ATP-binding protein [Calditrichaceae bacterium]